MELEIKPPERRLRCQERHRAGGTTRRTQDGDDNLDPAVGIGIYCAVLHALGLLEGISLLADRAGTGRRVAAEADPREIEQGLRNR